uniref:Major facilitator superfamily (MFS) profile domain-containing protein n=1 Tax=Ditylenchus dipsaci TaxID=166011 RepID=A0A915E6B5_9BILA
MWASYGTISSLVFYMCAYGIGSPIPWMITGEIFPQSFAPRHNCSSLCLGHLYFWFHCCTCHSNRQLASLSAICPLL